MPNTTFIDDCIALRDLTLPEIQSRFDMPDSAITSGVAYLKMTGLTMLYHPSAFPARFYFDGEALVMIYVPRDAPPLESLDVAAMQARLGDDMAKLRSRVGKGFVHYVGAEAGLAFSAGHGEGVVLLEVFPPMSQADYEDTIYEDPGPFVK